MAECTAPIPEETLLDYWARDLVGGDESDRVEEHLFACDDCSTHLQHLVALGAGLTTLAREGRLFGIVSRTILNRLQRDGLHVRMFSLLPGETVPCAVFPGDDFVVVALRAGLPRRGRIDAHRDGADSQTMDGVDDVPVPGPGDDVRGSRLLHASVSCPRCGCGSRWPPPDPRVPRSAGTCSSTRRCDIARVTVWHPRVVRSDDGTW